MSDVTILKADRWGDVEAGEVRSPAVIVIDGNQIVAVNPQELPSPAAEIDLGDVTLLPGLMDMELNMLIGGPGGPDGLPDPMHGVKDSPVYRTLRGVVNCRTTLEAGFTTVRNLGLMVYTAGFLLDVGRPRHHADRRAPRPDHVPGTRSRHHASERRAGDRQRRA
jgi:imidazolonepropionase-like amidohydrolase